MLYLMFAYVFCILIHMYINEIDTVNKQGGVYIAEQVVDYENSLEVDRKILG